MLAGCLGRLSELAARGVHLRASASVDNLRCLPTISALLADAVRSHNTVGPFSRTTNAQGEPVGGAQIFEKQETLRSAKVSARSGNGSVRLRCAPSRYAIILPAVESATQLDDPTPPARS